MFIYNITIQKNKTNVSLDVATTVDLSRNLSIEVKAETVISTPCIFGQLDKYPNSLSKLIHIPISNFSLVSHLAKTCYYLGKCPHVDYVHPDLSLITRLQRPLVT